jgi:hypothetical protein
MCRSGPSRPLSRSAPRSTHCSSRG